MSTTAIPKGACVLVTGANGYLASQVVNQLLLAGFRVRGTIRDEHKGTWMKEYFHPRFGADKLELVLVPDMAEPGAYNEAIKGVSGVVHIASPLTFDSDPNKVIPGAIGGMTHALEAALSEPSVKRFVYTSSSAAATWPNYEETIILDENTWNTGAVERAWAPPPYEAERSWDVYGASKTLSEQAMWKFVRDQKPHFVCNSVLPNAIFGSLLTPAQSNLSTGGFIPSIFEDGLDKVKSIPPQYYINIHDCAKLHVAVLIDPDVHDERIYGFAGLWNWNSILALLREIDPDHKFPEDIDGVVDDKCVVSQGARDRALGILNRHYGIAEWTGLEESIRANIAHMV